MFLKALLGRRPSTIRNMPKYKDKCRVCGQEFTNYTSEGWRPYCSVGCEADAGPVIESGPVHIPGKFIISEPVRRRKKP